MVGRNGVPLDVLEVIERNERLNEVGHDKALDQAN